VSAAGGRATTPEEFSIARQVIGRSRLVPALSPLLDSDKGRPRHLSLEGLLVAMQVNALHRHHQGHIIEVARILNAMTPEQREVLGITRWDAAEAYPRVDWLFGRLCRVLEDNDEGLDASWFANELARAAIPADLLTSRSVAVDGTDVETWAKLHGTTFTIELDGEAADTQLTDEDLPRPRGKVKTARVFAIGADGRKVYTKDRDARAGHRSATSQRSAGPYVGYELHLSVQTRDVRWTNYVDKTTLGPELPNVITTLNLVPAGSHRGASIVDHLIEYSRSRHPISDVVWDPGYSLCQPETTGSPLAAAGIEQTMQLVTHQRGIRPFAKDALLVDGQLYSRFLPAELRDLRMPKRGSRGAYRRAYEDWFNQRARWRLVRHSRPDADGFTRWRCPFCAGLLRSRKVPSTMRRPRRVPLVDLPEGETCCCNGTLTAPAVELPLTQRIPFGTTAWRVSMDRRQVVESANAALKGSFVDISRGFLRVFGRVKMSVVLGFTVAAYNLDRIRSFRAKQAELAGAPKRQPKRRRGTWGAAGNGAQRPPVATATGPPA
ncbi:MAG TPA: hypothetical protein VGP46_09790, partial [Acidimicrobiales bacterium]|nr:hypothetical protein [Acidimicrobiales bacterium]